MTWEYRKGSDPFSDDNCDPAPDTDTCQEITGTSVTITGLEDNMSYEVRIKANNGERASAWSASGTGRTNRANHQPIFDDRPHTGTGSEPRSAYTVWRTIDENPRSGQVVGRVFADDEDNDRLTYKLNGTDAGLFDFNETNGEIRTKAGVAYNYEAITTPDSCGGLDPADVGSDRCYEVTVEVRDGLNNDRVEVEEEDADDSITVKIAVRDRDEPPATPTVMVTSPAVNVTAALIVIWDARNTGPEITEYDVQYRMGGGTFSDDNCGSEDEDNCKGIEDTTTTTIIGLDEDTSYSVQVRAKNEEGTSAYSRVVTVKTNKGTNQPPVFIDTGDVNLTVAENTRSGRDVETAVDATDDITESPTYELGGRDAGSFTIVRTSGQIRTRASLNHEETPDCRPDDQAINNCYLVIVKVDDGAGGSASKEVIITVEDEDEPPSAPGAPRVTATKDTGWSLDVTWNEPRNTGKPPITDYDIEYREFKSGTQKDDWELWPHADGTDSTERSAKITRRLPAEAADPLEPSTQYEVRVGRRTEREMRLRTGRPVAKATTNPSNSRPSFDTGGAATLRVDENTRAGQNLGSAISASDADSNSLTYSLEGPGKDSFTIVSSSGQIRTRSALDHETGNSYSVTVKVDDRQRKDNSIAAKSVTIMVDDVREAPSPPAAPRVAGIPGSTEQAYGSRGTRPRTPGRPSPSTTCTTGRSGAAPRDGPTPARTGARSSRT